MIKPVNNPTYDEILEDLELMAEEEAFLEGGFEDTITTDDYGVILDCDGNIKAVYIPEDCGLLPQRVIEMLKTCGIENPQDTYCKPSYTLH